MVVPGCATSGSILHKIIANSCLYQLIAFGSFGSCLQQENVTSCPFRHGSCLLKGRLARLLGLGCVSAGSQHKFNGSTSRRLIRRHCRDADQIIWLSAKTKYDYEIKIHKIDGFVLYFKKAYLHSL